MLTFAGRGAHDGVTHALHNGFHVGEIAVDDAGNGDDVRYALHGLAQYVVSDAEGLEESCILRDGQELLVGDDNCRVD